MSFRLLIVDEFAPQYEERLRGCDATITIARTLPEAHEHIADADGVATFGTAISDQLLSEARSLQWIQALSAGVDSLLKFPSLRPDVIVTNVTGVHGPLVSEMALLLMLAAGRRLPALLAQQASGTWTRMLGSPLHGKTVGLAGVGDIGRHIARLCKSFGMTVIGFGAAMRREGDVDAFHLYGDLATRAADLDFLVMVSPLRGDTVNLVDRAVLTRMKPTAILVNVGRGRTVNEDDLIAALTDRTIAGAALDAHATEPLPSASPLWRMDNVIVTPHVAGYVDDYAARVAPIIARNLAAIASGNVAALVNRIVR